MPAARPAKIKPKDIIKITFPFSDGDKQLKPENLINSKVKYELKEKDSQSYKKYLKRAGESLAKALGFADSHLYQLQGFPDGYRLYVFDTIENGQKKKSAILFGKSYRRVADTRLFHLSKVLLMYEKSNDPTQLFLNRITVWLKTDKKQRHENCKCDKRYHIKHSLRSEAVVVSMKDPPPVVQETIIRPKQDYTIQPQTVAPQRLDRDRSTPSMIRLFELCWARLDSQGLPFVSPKDITPEHHKLFVDRNYHIEYWPGVVVDFQFSVEVKDGQPIQTRQFEVFLLGTKTLVMLDEERIRPYLALTVEHKHFPPTYFPMNRSQDISDVQILFENISNIPHISNQDIYSRSLALSIGIHASWHIKHVVTPLHHYQLIVKYQPEPLDCFKGIWLGGEMVWVGDMVRLHKGVKVGALPKKALSLGMLVKYIIVTNKTINIIGALYALEPSKASLDSLRHYPDIMLDKDSQHYLPTPPIGHKWSKVAPEKHHQVPLDVIGGRYYPDLHCEPGSIKRQLTGLEPAGDATMMSFNYQSEGSYFNAYTVSHDRNTTITKAEVS
ncbi:hypothetical protein E3P99_02560 [Wallemia hederae]|uniref:Cryptic loci regulator 2 C-terminal domain-containing protein n=1 Tax=Wallemia hederae TaxID=1540922 RepID=A0A4T0FM38_9BASI|nr:hypothetical protein E3P99_02560 [Wallemia hederae]